jgi:hypothetical protein
MPRITTSIAITTKVYGRSSASRTTHIAFLSPDWFIANRLR